MPRGIFHHCRNCPEHSNGSASDHYDAEAQGHKLSTLVCLSLVCLSLVCLSLVCLTLLCLSLVCLTLVCLELLTHPPPRVPVWCGQELLTLELLTRAPPCLGLVRSGTKYQTVTDHTGGEGVRSSRALQTTGGDGG